MRADEVASLAQPPLEAFFGGSLESVEVIGAEDWSGTPSLYIDVFLAPGTGAPDTDAWFKVRRALSDRLVAAGELRFPYITLRDRQEENEDAPDEAA